MPQRILIEAAGALAVAIFATAATDRDAIAAPKRPTANTYMVTFGGTLAGPRGPQLTTKPQTSARYFNGFVSRFSAGSRLQRY